ncbi:MAG: hypothetical protein ACOYNY_35930 [Caldilineaceae bacterium]
MSDSVQNQSQISTSVSKETTSNTAFLPQQLVLSSDAFQRLVDLIENPSLPTAAMVELMQRNSNSAMPTTSAY